MIFSALRLQLLQIGIPVAAVEAKYELVTLPRQRAATPGVTGLGVEEPGRSPAPDGAVADGSAGVRVFAPRSTALSGRATRVPPHAYFLVSAVFHYLGPAFAVMLFAQVA